MHREAMCPVSPANTLSSLITIPQIWAKNISALLGHAIAANAEKVQSVIQDFEMVLDRDFFLWMMVSNLSGWSATANLSVLIDNDYY
jgi:hypothetical protein